MSRKKQKNTVRSIPRFFREPLYPACVLLAIDILTLAAAIVYRNVGNGEAEYFMADGVVRSMNAADKFGGAAIAVLLGIAAIVAGMMIAGAVIRADRWDKSPVGGVIGSIMMFSVTVAVALFSLAFARGESATGVEYTDYRDDAGNHVMLSEESYRSGGRLKVFQIFEDDCVVLLAETPLAQVSAENEMSSRYRVSGGDGKVLIGFVDADMYKTLSAELQTDE